MTDIALSAEASAMLETIASPEVSGVPGALGDANIGELLAKGLVTFGCDPTSAPVPSGEDAWKQPMAITYGQMWVAPTAAGLAWIEAHPASVAP
jgi:hypothetical protein